MQIRDAGVIQTRAGRLALSLCLALVLSGTAYAAGWSADVGLTYDDNVNLGTDDYGILSDTFLTAGAGYSLPWRLNPHNRVVFRPFIEVHAYDKYSDLSHNAAGINISYQYRASGRPLAPTWSVFAKLWLDEYKSEFRDSTRYAYGANVRKALTDRLTLATVLSGTKRESDGVVWDTSDISLLGNLDFQIHQRATLYFTLDLRDGDIVSSAEPTLALANAIFDGYVTANQPDDGFGGNFIAYRFDGRTMIGKLGGNFMLDAANSIDVSLWYVKADADGNFSYDRTMLSVAYLTRF